MKRWIRWQGFIPFVCIIGLMLVFWYVFLDRIVERVIESAGTRMVGAKVEMDKADVSLFPLGLAIQRLQVTNPDSPMTNAVDIAAMKLSLDSGALLRKKIIVDELSMGGVRFNTARKTSGAVEVRRKRNKKSAPAEEKIKTALKKAGCATVELPSLQLPDVQKIIASENLESLERIKNFQTRLETEKQAFQKTIATLPNEKTFAEYRTRLEKLQGRKSSLGALLNTVSDAANLQKDIQADVDALKKEMASVRKTISEFNTQYSQLAKAPREDIRRLKEKYSVSYQGASNLSRLLVGTRLCDGWEKAYAWYLKIKPYLERPSKEETEQEKTTPARGKGINVKFPEKNPLPDFLVRLAKANIVLNLGELTGVLENVTPDQHMTGKPVTFRFLGRQMKGLESFNALGEINHVRENVSKYRLDMNVEALKLKNFALSTAKAFPVTLNEAVSDMSLHFELDGSELSGLLKSDFKAVKMGFDSKAETSGGGVAKAMASALSGIKSFYVNATVTGSPRDYGVDIRSDLDAMLRSAVGNLVREAAHKLTAGLEKEILQRVAQPLAKAQKMLKDFPPMESELSRRLDLGNSLLKADVLKKLK